MLAMRHAVKRLGKASKRFQCRTAAAVKLQAAFRAHKARQLARHLRAARDWKLIVSPTMLPACSLSGKVVGRFVVCVQKLQGCMLQAYTSQVDEFYQHLPTDDSAPVLNSSLRLSLSHIRGSHSCTLPYPEEWAAYSLRSLPRSSPAIRDAWRPCRPSRSGRQLP